MEKTGLLKVLILIGE